MIQTGTFAQWVKEQADRQDRQDDIGFFARTWEQVTPGKISSVDGIKRHLDRIAKQAADAGDETAQNRIGAALSGFSLAVREYHQARAAAEAASQGLEVRMPQPDDNPPFPERAEGKHVPEPPPGEAPMRVTGALSPADRLAEHVERVASQPGRGVIRPAPGGHELVPDRPGPETVRSAVPDIQREAVAHPELYGLPETRLDRITASQELLHDRLELIERKLAAILDALYPEPIDWDRLWRDSAEYRDAEFSGGDSQ
jgi:hypothetical protein